MYTKHGTILKRPQIHNIGYILENVLGSPEPKAQVIFSDQNVSVASRCRSRCRCCKIFTLSSSIPEPLG